MSVIKAMLLADCLPPTAIATLPPSNRPIGKKLKAFVNNPVIPTATNGCTDVTAGVAASAVDVCRN